MRSIVKKVVLKIFDPIATRLGYSQRRKPEGYNSIANQYSKDSLLNSFYSVLKAIPFIPKHIVDVGANHGTWTRKTLQAFPDCYFTLFEPQAEMETSISDILSTNSRVSFHASGVGKQSGSFRFTITERDDSCNFRYTESEAESAGLKQIEVPVVTLNEFFQNKNLPSPDIIKIDAEGIDLEVLQGASNFLGRTEVFMVEAGIVNKKFKNSALNVVKFMDANGYRLFDITDINRPFTPSVLWLVELVFVKKFGVIDSFKWR